MFKRAPMSTSTHPLENVVRNKKQNAEDATIQMAAKNFGLGFALHLKHERAAVSI